MHICEQTGLLYINEVPFTLDHLKKIRKLFKYGKKTNDRQFKHEVLVVDTNTGSQITVDEALISDIFKLYDLKKIARDKHFTM